SGGVAGADGEPDRRQPRQRRADALVALAETALGVAVPRRGERPRVVVHVTPGQLDGTAASLAQVEGDGPVSPRVTRRLTCDAVLQRVVTTPSLGPLDVGREHRLVTLAQRRALAARDGGCTVPGCGAPPDWCDAHHIVHWADGGPSDLDNYTLLCPGHHTAVHAGTWQVHTTDGQITVTPPRWVDPTRTPRPVRYHRVEQALADLDLLGTGAEGPAPPADTSPPDRQRDSRLHRLEHPPDPPHRDDVVGRTPDPPPVPLLDLRLMATDDVFGPRSDPPPVPLVDPRLMGTDDVFGCPDSAPSPPPVRPPGCDGPQPGDRQAVQELVRTLVREAAHALP
ncbi:HNH endonuclease signature motif containing protein, partial [Aquipuribacter hungaricus]